MSARELSVEERARINTAFAAWRSGPHTIATPSLSFEAGYRAAIAAREETPRKLSDERTVRIDAEIESVGQFDRTERWRGKLDITREADGRVRIGEPSQSGFAALMVDWDDLKEAVAAIESGRRA